MALVVRDPRHDGWAPATAPGCSAGPPGAYLLSRNTAIPGLVPHREALDPLGFVVSTAEVVAVFAAIRLITRKEH